MTYSPTTPTGTVPLNQDYVNLQTNFQVLDTDFGINHIPFSQTPNKGKHTFIQLPNTTLAAINASSGGPLVVGDETLYSKAFVQGELAFTRGNSGVEIQLTGPGNPVAAATGSTFLAGGIILQWGTVSFAGTGNYPVSFSPTFGTVFTVIGSGQTNTSPTNDAFIIQSTISTTGFTVKNLSASLTGFGWFAIGK
jgi:hypothetical protein